MSGGPNPNRKYTFKTNLLKCLLQAKELSRKKMDQPSTAQWFKELSLCYLMKKITFILKDKQEMFWKVWGRFIQYINNNDLSHQTSVPELDTCSLCRCVVITASDLDGSCSYKFSRCIYCFFSFCITVMTHDSFFFLALHGYCFGSVLPLSFVILYFDCYIKNQ